MAAKSPGMSLMSDLIRPAMGDRVTQKSSGLLASKAGYMRDQVNRSTLWVASNPKRYVPALEDPVIGIAQAGYGEEYRLHMNRSDTVTLSMLALEGATKKNRPNLAIGALIYCRVVRQSKSMETAVSCIEPDSTKC
ncbi:Exosome complex RNA-binding protein 1/RRP40/RRP4 [Gracilaria domingensis]|nr:Exosome complex RNA-binding protein 1/RRP40/RRP4 [Gracilaria domingensis]